jgi:hypothetical protein
VYGASQVRSAHDPASLAAALEGLFTPLGPGIVVGTTMPPPPRIGDADPTFVA